MKKLLKLDAKKLRSSTPDADDLAKIKRRKIYIICDDVLDTYNIGSIFRLADAIGAEKVYLCKGSETPPNSRIAKASVGTDKWVRWEYFPTALEAIHSIKNQVSGIKIVAIEQGKGSVDFRKIDYKLPIAFVVGHETYGLSKETLKLCDQIVEIPMHGVNISLNVMVSLGIVLFRTV